MVYSFTCCFNKISRDTSYQITVKIWISDHSTTISKGQGEVKKDNSSQTEKKRKLEKIFLLIGKT